MIKHNFTENWYNNRGSSVLVVEKPGARGLGMTGKMPVLRDRDSL
jgi:hypothetical protein